MRKISLITLSLLSGIVSFTTQPTFSMNTQTPYQENTEKLPLSMKFQSVKSAMNIKLPQDAQPICTVALIGSTGSGKTTLEKYLRGLDLYVKKQNLRVALETGDHSENLSISHTSTSGTFVPHSHFNAAMNCIIRDTAGRGDSRGPEEEVINALTLDLVLNNPSLPIKVMLVVPEPSISDPRTGTFLRDLRMLTDSFSDLDQLKSCLSLVITKQRDIELSDLCDFLNEESNNTDFHKFRDVRVRELLNFLKNNAESRIAFFPSQQKVGKYAETQARNNIISVVLDSESIQSPQVKISVDVSAHEFIRNSADELNRSIIDYVKEEGKKGIINYCLNQIEHLDEKDGIQGLKKEFEAVVSNLSDLVKISSEQPLDFPNALSRFMNVDNIIETIYNISFLKGLNENITYNTGGWADAFSETIDQIKAHLLAPYQVEYNKFGVLYIQGKLLDVQDINREIQQAPGRVTSLVVNSDHIILINESMKIPGIHRSFNTLGKMAVVGNPCIDTSGQNGYSGQNGGYPGSPGCPQRMVKWKKFYAKAQ